MEEKSKKVGNASSERRTLSKVVVLTLRPAMSNLSVGQHKQLLAAIVDYLQDLQASAPAGLVADSLELNNALRSLRSAASLSDASALELHSIAPHSLASIFSGAGIPAPVRHHSSHPISFEPYQSRLANLEH